MADRFNGLVFTDDLDAQSVSGQYGVGETTLRALQAGADVGLWATSDEVPEVLDPLEKAGALGELNMATVDASVQRVAAAKGSSCGD